MLVHVASHPITTFTSTSTPVTRVNLSMLAMRAPYDTCHSRVMVAAPSTAAATTAGSLAHDDVFSAVPANPAMRCTANLDDDDALVAVHAAATQLLPLCAAEPPTQPARHNLHVTTCTSKFSGAMLPAPSAASNGDAAAVGVAPCAQSHPAQLTVQHGSPLPTHPARRSSRLASRSRSDGTAQSVCIAPTVVLA